MSYILIDLETRDFTIEKGGIYQVGLVATNENFEIIEAKELSIIENKKEIKKGYGYGYKNISENEKIKNEFKKFLEKYNGATLIAHNSSFDKKFLSHYNWLNKNTKILNSIVIVRREIEGLESYALDYLAGYFKVYEESKEKYNGKSHTALFDAIILQSILYKLQPTKFLTEYYKKKKRDYSKKKDYVREAIKKDVEVINNIFSNEVICFTGKGTYARKYLIEIAKENGAECTNTITKKTTLLVVGSLMKKSSKMKEAEEKGIKIISFEEFMEIVNNSKSLEIV